MIRSMFTAINSLNLYQSFMDVVANNLSNANTTGYKASRFTFQDQISQMLNTGSAPTAEMGGVNPTQIGLGSRLGAITTTFTQGTLQSTGRSMDLAIDGDGFFTFSDGRQSFYSRDGAMAIDPMGNLVSAATGMRIQGWEAKLVGTQLSVDTNAPMGDMKIPLGSTLARATSKVVMGGNLDSTLDLGAGDAYASTIGVYDSLGVPHDVTLTFTHTGDGTWTWASSTGAITGTTDITFDGNGKLTAGAGTITLPASGGAPATTITVDLAGITQLATENTAAGTSQDGLAAGSLVSFDVVSNTGEVLGVYSNGMKQLVGQLGLATFFNPSGLVHTGQNMYQQGINTGEPNVGIAGTGTRGTISAGSLEASNVDLSQEFTNMILAQRGFQASSRIITTSDEMLQELVNIKR